MPLNNIFLFVYVVINVPAHIHDYFKSKKKMTNFSFILQGENKIN